MTTLGDITAALAVASISTSGHANVAIDGGIPCILLYELWSLALVRGEGQHEVARRLMNQPWAFVAVPSSSDSFLFLHTMAALTVPCALPRPYITFCSVLSVSSAIPAPRCAINVHSPPTVKSASYTNPLYAHRG